MNPRENTNPDDQQWIDAGYRYAFSLTHHRQDAEDLMQHACLKIFRAKHRFQSKAYLFTTIRNLFLDQMRKRSVSSLDDLPEAALIDPVGDHTSASQRSMDLQCLLGKLRPQEREALYLHCVEGYTAGEISKLTGQPRSTVLSHLARAKKRLRPTNPASDEVEAS